MAIYPDPLVNGEDYWLDVQVWAAEQGHSSPTSWRFETAEPRPSWGAFYNYGPEASDPGTNRWFMGVVPAEGTTERTMWAVGSFGQLEAVEIPAPTGPVPVTPEPPVFDVEASVVTIPEADHVDYTDGQAVLDPGPYDVERGTVFTVYAVAHDGYVIDGPESWTFNAPPPDPEDAYAAWAERATERVEVMLGGRPTPSRTDTAREAVDLITAYVDGYTGGHEGRGWTEDGVPDRRLTAVIIVAAVRLASNPRQVTVYTTSDYTERPAVMAGWTLAERAVLRRYRRVTA